MSKDELVRTSLRIPLRGVEGEMAGIDGDGEVGAAALAVGGIDGGVEAMVEVIADRGGEMAAGGEAEHADLVRIDVPLGGVKAYQTEGALRVFQSDRGLGIGA